MSTPLSPKFTSLQQGWREDVPVFWTHGISAEGWNLRQRTVAQGRSHAHGSSVNRRSL